MNIETQEALYLQLLNRFEYNGNKQAVASTHVALGVFYLEHEDFEESYTAFETGISIFEELKLDFLVSKAIYQMLPLLQIKKEYPNIVERGYRALTHFHETKQTLHIRMMVSRLKVILANSGNTDFYDLHPIQTSRHLDKLISDIGDS